ncbi:MAG: NADH-quinone oxidoreductase subunit N [Phycisphaerales bacterium]
MTNFSVTTFPTLTCPPLLATNPMVEKLQYLYPEMVLFAATVVVMIIGLSPNRALRRSCAWISGISLVIAGVLAALHTPSMPSSPFPAFMPFAKVMIAAVGVLLVMVLAGTVDRGFEKELDEGKPFDALRANRAEFYAFFLFSLTGLMLCTGADDLIWIFLALELTSLPTYVMVSISTARARSMEAGVKYFFLGALGAATFLYGFALLYGATGTTALFGTATDPGIAQILSAQIAGGGLSTLAMLGLVISIIGVSFKIAAVPMHFYTPDVYQGSSASVAAFLAFVPKAAGFIVLMLLLSCVGWGAAAGGEGQAAGLPDTLRILLWVMAALTMTVGNVLAVLQSNVKRMLAYSSIAHSGYMLVGLLVGPGAAAAVGATTDESGLAANGLAAMLFYLMCYGFMNLGAFAVLACLENARTGEEIEDVDDLRGLFKTHPVLACVMVLCALSLLGFPILLGFVGKLYLFTSAISASELLLVIVMGLNSAIGAFYYLRLVFTPFLADAEGGDEPPRACPYSARGFAAAFSAASVIALVFPSANLMRRCNDATRFTPPIPAGKPTAQSIPSDENSPAAKAAKILESTQVADPVAQSR